MVDFSGFSDADFNVKKWINASLVHSSGAGAGAAPAQVDANLSTIMMKIQLLSQDCHSVIDDLSSNLLLNMPRVMHESERIASDSLALRTVIRGIQSKLDEIEGHSAQSVQELDTLDQVKTRMETALLMLREAGRFDSRLSRLQEDVEGAELRPEALKGLAEKLAAVQSSLRVLQSLETFTVKKQHVQELEDRLSAKVKLQLEDALARRLTDPIRDCISIYERMGKVDMLPDLFVSARTAVIVALYERHKRPSTGEGAELMVWLPAFYDELVVTVEQELSWCMTISSEGATFVAHLVAKALTPISAPINIELERVVSLKDGLPNLISLFKAASECGRAIRKITADGRSASHAAASSVLLPFRQLQRRYASLEKTRLQREISRLNLKGRALDETIGLLRDSVGPFFSALDGAIERCHALTDSSESAALVSVLGDVVGEYFDSLTNVLQQLRSQARLPAESGDGDATAAVKLPTEPDWASIQGALQLRQYALNLSERLLLFDATLKSSLQSRISALLAMLDADEPSSHFLHDDTARREQLRKFGQRVSDGSLLAASVTRASHWNEAVNRLVTDCAVNSVRGNLEKLSSQPSWRAPAADEDGAFSLSPLVYVSRIGEHLLELPQHFEISAVASDAAGGWLDDVASTTVALYIRAILGVEKLSDEGCRQLSTDIVYLCNVLDALGVTPHNMAILKDINELLLKPIENMGVTLQTLSAIPHDTYTALLKMRQAA